MRSICLAAIGLVLSASAVADQVDFGLNNDAFSLRYNSARANGSASVDLDWYHHIKLGNVAGAGFKIDQYRGFDRYSLGGKLVMVSNDWDVTSALAIGGSLSVALPGEPRVRFGGHAWFAPAVTSFGGSDGLVDLEARVGYRVLDRGEVYLAYRYIDVSYENHIDLRLEDGLMVGLQLTF